MAKMGKKYIDSTKLIDKAKAYEVAEAMNLVCQTAKAKFDETVEVHVRLGVDSRQADQQVRGAIVLPNGTGKHVRVLVFAKGDNVQKALDAGAEYAGGAEYVEKITKENWFEFDVVIASPDMMAVIGRLGKVLGPKPAGARSRGRRAAPASRTPRSASASCRTSDTAGPTRRRWAPCERGSGPESGRRTGRRP